jgi:hypothetical protein
MQSNYRNAGREIDRINKMNRIKGKAPGFFESPCLNLDNLVNPVYGLALYGRVGACTLSTRDACLVSSLFYVACDSFRHSLIED